MDKVIVKIEKSGNRFNAFDKDGNKYTGNITLGARRKAFVGKYPLGRFTNKSGNYYWRQVSSDMMGTLSYSYCFNICRNSYRQY